MVTAIHWREWLRQPIVVRFDVHSPIEVEDYLQDHLPDDRTAFVFNDTDLPLMQAIINQWETRYTNRQLVEIYNALVKADLRVEKFSSKDQAYRQISLEIYRLASQYLPLTTKSNPKELRAVMTDDTAHDDMTEDTAAEQAVEKSQVKAESKAELRRQAAARKREEKEEMKAKKLAEREAAKAAKMAEKTSAKQSAKATRPTGVIGSLVTLLTDGQKRTVDELYTELADKFPDRGEGMKTTIRIQLVRLQSEGKLNIYSENRKDENGKRIPGKRYWGSTIDTGATAEADIDTDTDTDTEADTDTDTSLARYVGHSAREESMI